MSFWTDPFLGYRTAASGAGESFLALGYAEVRAGHTSRFIHTDGFFRAMSQTRVDNSLNLISQSFLLGDDRRFHAGNIHRALCR